jgi:hypothetical protein
MLPSYRSGSIRPPAGAQSSAKNPQNLAIFRRTCALRGSSCLFSFERLKSKKRFAQQNTFLRLRSKLETPFREAKHLLVQYLFLY